MKTAAKIILETRTPLSTGKCPVKIRVKFTKIVDGKSKFTYNYYSTGDEMFKEEFEKLFTSKALEDRRKKIVQFQQKAESILEKKPHILKEDFDYQFHGKGNFESLQGLMEILKAEADKNGQIVTRNLLGSVKNSVTEFTKSEIPIIDADESFLTRYEEWLLSKGISYNTIGIYTRYLRETWNFAIFKGIVSKELYPFGRRKYVPPATVARKIALSEDQLTKLLNYSSHNYWLQRAVDFWKLSFYCFGMNFKDIASLKWGHFETVFDVKVISIYRAKTFGSRKKRIMKKIDIPVTEKINDIIKRYGQISLDPNAYVFSIFELGLTPEQITDRMNKFIARINGRLAEISNDLGLPKITTYTARHTFAYIMKKRGFSLDMRQDFMDHADQKTTQGYGGGSGFDIEDKVNAAKRLYS